MRSVICRFFLFQVESKCSPGQKCLCAQTHACVYLCVLMCVCACGTIGGGGALLVVERWNINATLPLISLHLSPTCPLRVSPSKSMNRHSSDINRQLVCSVFQRQNTKTSLAPIFFLLPPFSSFVLKNIKISFLLRLVKVIGAGEAFIRSLTPRLRPRQIYQFSERRTSLRWLQVTCVCVVFWVFFLNAIFNLLDFEHEEPG